MALALPVDISAAYTQNTTPGTTFASASWTPTAHRLYFVETLFSLTGATASLATSLTGNGITWTKYLESNTIDGGTKRATLWIGYSGSSPTTGALTLTLPVSHGSCTFTVTRQDGPTSLAAVVQGKVFNISNVATIALTPHLDPFNSANNSTLVFGAAKGQATGISVKDGTYTELRDSGIDNTRRVFTAAKLGADVAPSFTVTGDPDGIYTGQGLIIFAVEVVEVTAGWTVDIQAIVDIDPTATPDAPTPRWYYANDGALIPIQPGVLV